VKFTSKFTAPYYTGSPDRAVSAPSLLVPGQFNGALNGRPYMLDQENDLYGVVSIPRTRPQADNAQVTSERSLNPEGLWRRSTETLHRGAGQRYADMPDSVPDRFWASQGIDPWTRGVFTLLPATDRKRASTNDVLDLEVCGGRFYLLDGDELLFVEDLDPDGPLFTTVEAASTALSGALSMCADGKNVYAIDGTDIYYTANNTTTYQTATGGDAAAVPGDVIRYVKGRLFVLDGHVWQELNGQPGNLQPTEVYSHINDDFTWVDVTAGPQHIYAAGYSGDKSLIYRTGIQDNATELSAPTAIVELPDGEIVRSINVYLQFLMIGTDRGLRFAVLTDAGGATLGQLLPLNNAVFCAEGQDRFVWFGWSNYTDSSTGLGRLDLSVLNDGLPAYATDLMATTQGAVRDVVTFQNRRVFAVQGDGVWAEDTIKCESGTIDLGLASFGITEQKTALFIDTQWAKGEGVFLRHFAVDEGPFDSVAGNQPTGNLRGSDSTVSLSEKRGRLLETRYELFRAPGDPTSAPKIARSTLRVQPAARPGIRRRWPLILHPRVTTADDGTHEMDVQQERDLLEELHRDTRVVTSQHGMAAYTVILEEFEWQPEKEDPTGQAGTFVAVLKDVDS
jgi:hypothetical protein